MLNYRTVTKKEASIEDTINLRRLIGKRVLSEGGAIVGRISEVRVDPEGFELEGVVVSRGFESPIYIGKSYFAKLSNYSVILNTELSVLLNGRKVLTTDGKVIGKIIEINRKGTTNDIESILVGRWWKKYLIPVSDIKQIGNSVLIKTRHDEAKNYLWTRPKQDSNV